MGANYRGPTVQSMAHRLRHAGARALARPESDPVRKLGLTWYDKAGAWVAALARDYARQHATLESVAGAVAAMSPQVSWLDQTRFVPGFLESVLVARDLQTLPHPGFFRNRAKARDILLGADPERILGGPKVTAFYACILGSKETVCIDRHAATMAQGRRVPSFTDAAARAMRESYTLAARWLDIAPRDLQSLLWCDYKARGLAEQYEQPTFFADPPTLAELGLAWRERGPVFLAPDHGPAVDSGAQSTLAPGPERERADRILLQTGLPF